MIASVAVTVSAVKSAQLFITLYKICQFVGLKKKEVTTIVCVFFRKAPTKKGPKTFTPRLLGCYLARLLLSKRNLHFFKKNDFYLIYLPKSLISVFVSVHSLDCCYLKSTQLFKTTKKNVSTFYFNLKLLK